MLPLRAVRPQIPPPPPDPEELAANRRRVFTCGCLGCGGLFFFLGMGLLLVAAVPNPVALGVAAFAAVLPVPTYTFLVLQLDRYEHEPWQVLVAAFLWGALVATFIAAIFNDVIGAVVTAIVGKGLGDVLTTSAVAPIVEETAKGFALLLLYWIIRHEFDNVLDGIVYGSLVGHRLRDDREHPVLRPDLPGGRARRPGRAVLPAGDARRLRARALHRHDRGRARVRARDEQRSG